MDPQPVFFRSLEGASHIHLDIWVRLDSGANPPAIAIAMCAGGNTPTAIYHVRRALGVILEPGL